jgi:4-phospho-D-threonate 3-dehydrogenase / 4-phospho-D-erythronate 3-dehydrogenase
MAVRKPIILITMGDPNGIGPEIAVKALGHEKVRRCCTPRIVGSPEVIESAARSLGVAPPAGDTVAPAGGKAREELAAGTVQAEAGRLACDAVSEAHRLIEAGLGDGLVTAPWCKEALHANRCPHVGHTETLAALTGHADPVTLFVCGPLRIAFLTRHHSLRDAVRQVQKKRIVSFVKRLDRELAGIGMTSARIAVAALNPHGGEGGLLGREEIEEILPAVETLRGEGIAVSGPVPADAVFHEAATGAYDCVVSLYHDQGHIASKTRDFFGTVSLTLGLPYIRTSPDHGTAFDIAGSNTADATSLIKAVELAARLVKAGKASAAG